MVLHLQRGRKGTTTAETDNIYAFRCIRRWLWWNSWSQRAAQYTGFVGGARVLGSRGASDVNNSSKTSSDPTSSLPVICRLRIRPPRDGSVNTRMKSSGCLGVEHNGFSKPRVDVRTPVPPETSPRSKGAHQSSMAPVCGQQVCRLIIADVGPRGHSSLASFVAKRLPAIQYRRSSVSSSTNERASTSPLKDSEGSARSELGRRTMPSLESAVRLPALGPTEDRTGESKWYYFSAVLAGPTVVRALETHGQFNDASGRASRATDEGPRHQPLLAYSRRSNTRIRHEWSAGIRRAILSTAGYSTTTGGAEEAARLLSELGWSESTWTSRASQVAKWMRFCDEDLRLRLPADEGDILAYVGYLSLERSISTASLPQYLSAVSRYHELHHLTSSTKTPLVRALTQAYSLQYDMRRSEPRPIRVGCPASLIRQVIDHGMTTTNTFDIACCAMVTMAFIFQVRSVALGHVTCKDVFLDDHGLSVTFYVRKGRSTRFPLILQYPSNTTWTKINPLALIRR